MRPRSDGTRSGKVAGSPIGCLGGKPGEGADHRCDEFVKGENRRGRKPRQNDDRLAAGDSQAQRLARLQRDPVDDDAGIVKAGNRAIAQIARALRGATGKDNHVAGCEPLIDQPGQHRFVVGSDAERQGMPPASSTAAARIAAFES